ncbi:hypothetical protein CTAYLR_004026 [Chrysophaeum taylorii]|uniref:Uncharacterized protein n=1 Tax=Chrysophaeum taylorii TaxID=2483200 RepID=A0AAD7XKV7_9STRA|nr:hypothetical protein CTAYLR_004026 [Chrysophaeum taylorii]
MLFWVVASSAAAFVSQQHLVPAKRVGLLRRVAPSGIDALPLAEQAAVFASVYAGLGASTVLATRGVESLKQIEAFRQWTRTFFLIGAIFAVIGVSHFTAEDAYLGIYPPRGTWGFWNLPGSPEFHVRWTGAAEILGGAGLFIGGLAKEIAPDTAVAKLAPLASVALFALVLCVTPANIYMYTHGAEMVGIPPPGPLPLTFHYVRFALQVLLLTVLATLASSSSSSGEETG